ncbi:hypothetical protein [Roseateles koreensis]|uniref:Uncharacterized protein n=1 Tax=Roseateles koreensis TaxID=2987526 RepID=A0ABT5KX05_9BURK|nr:hypothetical protein [Roseateles koreensis]MDC8786307.1 hypothetical protein [Roseateles koreensis]
MISQLLAVVEVDKADRVVCQAVGCGHGVFRRIHVVRHGDGSLGVYGSDCFGKLFGQLANKAPQYGSGDGRELTPEERLMLAENTERLVAQFEAEYQALAAQERLRREQQEMVERAAQERAERLRAEAERRRPPAPAEIASVERAAKALVRQKFNVDPDAPGWRGLVLVEARKLLGR